VGTLRQRLAVSTPATDQYIQHVWPTDVPWQDRKGLAVSLKAAQPYACAIKGCKFCGTNQESLAHHLRTRHSKYEILDVLGNTDPDVELVGGYVMVPPFAPPIRAPMPVCPYHYRNKIRCPTCEDIKSFAKSGPMPPLKLYKRVKVKVPHETVKGDYVQRTFNLQEAERTPYIVNEETGAVQHVQLWAICEDCRGEKYVGLSVFWDYYALKDIGFRFSQLGKAGFDKQHELIQDVNPIYLPVTRIMGVSFTLNTDRSGWNQKKNTNQLPAAAHDSLVKFSRFAFDSKTGELKGDRMLFPSAYDSAAAVQG